MIKAAVHGFGNIGKHVLDSLLHATDLECTGVIRRSSSLGKDLHDLRGIPDFSSFEQLVSEKGKPDVVVLCTPSRAVPEAAVQYLGKGIHTVDSFDIHAEIPALVFKLHPVAAQHDAVCVTSAGWDPGTDSVLRALFEAMVPSGTTFTNFGRGRSMGHSVVARSITGVADAVSITIPVGGGRHSRLVYLLMDKQASFEQAKLALAQDPYFSHDPLDVRQVKTAEELDAVADNSHGLLMERIGSSGGTSNQRLLFDMRIDNPALTAQILVSCARATARLQPGCYTLIDIPPVALLPGDRMEHIARLV